MSGDFVWGLAARETVNPSIQRCYLDGDVSRIEYLDRTRDGGLNPLFKPGRTYAGRAVSTNNIPTKMEWGSNEVSPPDVLVHASLYLVSERFVEIVENTEQNVHQFFPLQLQYKNGALAKRLFFFNICSRADSMNRDHATARFDGRAWIPGTGNFAFSKAAVGNRHAWVDRHILHSRFISDSMKRRLENENLTGIYFEKFPLY